MQDDLTKNEFDVKGVTLTLSTFIDGKNFKAGGHKIGLSLELEQ